MAASLYCEILHQTLLPFIQEHFPPQTTHRFMQNNDPKHSSRVAQQFYTDFDINWWKTPAESPDINPIENLWHELKEHIRREIKPTTKNELIDGINHFWATVDIHKCRRYINHLKKVLPRVIELNGEATGYNELSSLRIIMLNDWSHYMNLTTSVMYSCLTGSYFVAYNQVPIVVI